MKPSPVSGTHDWPDAKTPVAVVATLGVGRRRWIHWAESGECKRGPLWTCCDGEPAPYLAYGEGWVRR